MPGTCPVRISTPTCWLICTSAWLSRRRRTFSWPDLLSVKTRGRGIISLATKSRTRGWCGPRPDRRRCQSRHFACVTCLIHYRGPHGHAATARSSSIASITMNKDQYGIDVPALPRFMRRLDAVCLCRGGGGGKKKKSEPSYSPPPQAQPNYAAQQAAAAAQQRAAQQQAAAAQARMAEMARQQAEAEARQKAEMERIAAENKRIAAESASYDQAKKEAASSSTAPAVDATAGEDPAAAARRRRRGLRTSILAGETGLAPSSTLG